MKKEAGIILLSIGIAAAIIGGYIGYTKYKEEQEIKEDDREFLNMLARSVLKNREEVA